MVLVACGDVSQLAVPSSDPELRRSSVCYTSSCDVERFSAVLLSLSAIARLSCGHNLCLQRPFSGCRSSLRCAFLCDALLAAILLRLLLIAAMALTRILWLRVVKMLMFLVAVLSVFLLYCCGVLYMFVVALLFCCCSLSLYWLVFLLCCCVWVVLPTCPKQVDAHLSSSFATASTTGDFCVTLPAMAHSDASQLACAAGDGNQLPAGSASSGSHDATRDALQLPAGSASVGSADGPPAAARLRLEDVTAIQNAEAARGPPRSLHNLARDALGRISARPTRKPFALGGFFP